MLPFAALVAAKSAPETAFPAFMDPAEATSAPPERIASATRISRPAERPILLKLISVPAAIEPDSAWTVSSPPPALTVPDKAMSPDAVFNRAAPSAFTSVAVIPEPALRLAFRPAEMPPAAMAPSDVSSTLRSETTSPASERKPFPASRTTSSSAATTSRVIPLAALTTTRFFDVTFLASTWRLFERRFTPSRADALPSEIRPSAESVRSSALAAMSPRIRTPAPLSVTTILIRSACMAPNAEPSMANSPESSAPSRAVASPVA